MINVSDTEIAQAAMSGIFEFRMLIAIAVPMTYTVYQLQVAGGKGCGEGRRTYLRDIGTDDRSLSHKPKNKIQPSRKERSIHLC
jgi:hypothetical protein